MDNPTIVFPEPGEVVVENRERPDPGPGEVLVETDATLVSTGTELTVLAGNYPDNSVWDEYGQYPFTPGYANVGVVREAGPEADIEPGTRVATRTPHAAWVTASAATAIPVLDGLSDAEVAPFAIAQIVMNGVRRGRIEWGEAVAVYGLGILGQLAVRFARVAGASHVLGVDVAAARRDYLPEDPAVTPVDPDVTDPRAAMVEAVARPADLAFEVTGSPGAIPGEFDVLREQGRLVLLSSPDGKTALDFHDRVNRPSTEIIGAHELSTPPESTPNTPWSARRNADLYFRYVREGRVDVEPLYTHAVDYDAAPGTYDDLLEDRTDALGVRIEW
jgi:2-desacetyl-2-hydroxyethyl bacteriochlorophyllide A dehydrogenase